MWVIMSSSSLERPAGFEEHIIDGGCHAAFGSYGAQEGDGTASITAEEQTEMTVQLLTAFFAQGEENAP